MKTTTRILTRADLARVLSMDEAVAAVEGAFLAHGRGEARMPPKVYLPLPEHAGDFRAMPASLGASAGVKWVNAHPENPRRHGLPSVLGVYILSDPATALPLAILDGTLLTAARTGAAAAVASKFLADRNRMTLGIVGCGAQAPTLLRAHRVVFSEIPFVAYDARPEAAEAFALAHGGRAGSLEEACACGIVCTATPSHTPFVPSRAIGPGTHINAMGADGPGKEELDPAILRRGRIFVDDPAQALHSGEVNVPLRAGILQERDIAGRLGEVVAGVRPGRQSPSEITIFDSTGLAIQDLALARRFYETACSRGLGLEVDLLGLSA